MKDKKTIPPAKKGSRLTNYSLVVLAGIMQAFSLYLFILPNNFSAGGVTGIATAIQYFTQNAGVWGGKGINSGYLMILFNIPLLFAAWFFFKRDYVIKTAISITLTSVLLIIFPIIFPLIGFNPTASNQPILYALAGGVLSGVGLGILIRMGGSNGGSEIIGGFIQRKYPEYNIAWFIFGLDTIVVLSTAFILNKNGALEIVILSIIKMFCTSRVCSTILEGFNSALKFEVVTMHPEHLSRDIFKELGRGVTKITAKGGYTGEEKTMLICLIRKRQIGQFQRILKKYPDTFAYIMNTKEVYGQGFSPNTATESGKKKRAASTSLRSAPPSITRPDIVNGNSQTDASEENRDNK